MAVGVGKIRNIIVWESVGFWPGMFSILKIVSTTLLGQTHVSINIEDVGIV